MDIAKYKEISDRWEYTFDCPLGVWIGRLDAKAWGKKSNILLYFSEVDSGKKYCISVYRPTQHRAEDGGLTFRYEGEPGDLFELSTAKTRTGKSKLVSAKQVTPPPRFLAEAESTLCVASVPSG
jgi:hypothetical protein